MEKIRIGVVGAGWFGNEHVDRLIKRDDVKVVAVVNGGEEALRNIGRKVPEAGLYRSYEEMVAERDDLDALVVCVQPHRHGNIEQDAAKRGLHLFVEKPLGLSLEKAKENLAIIEASGIVCAVDYQERYAEGIAESRAALAGKPIGAISGWWIDHMPAAPWWRDKEKSGGQIVEQSTHIIDLLRYFAGEAEEVYAFSGNSYVFEDPTVKTDSASLSTIKFKNGTVGSLTSGCYLSEAQSSEIGIHISAKDLSVSFVQNDKVICEAAGTAKEFPIKLSTHDSAMNTFIEAVKTKDTSSIRSDYRDALETFKLTLALELSIKEHRPVALAELA
ncbi:MAG: Gfo/Idh/MocA family oxidoreductase [Clostridiales Family XIII bacterium]|nr:Gfo/Idh/MocA family oxidoreductase [Clostridiales Family XIII bacterium]